jgi:hypothetical protein
MNSTDDFVKKARSSSGRGKHYSQSEPKIPDPNPHGNEYFCLFLAGRYQTIFPYFVNELACLVSVFLSIILVPGLAAGRIVRRVAGPQRQVVTQQLHDQRGVLQQNSSKAC